MNRQPSDLQSDVGVRLGLPGRRGIAPTFVENHRAGHDQTSDQRNQQEDPRHRKHAQHDVDADVVAFGRPFREVDDDRLLRQEEVHGLSVVNSDY